MRVTVFPDKFAKSKTETDETFETLCESIINAPAAPYKEDCRWIKLGAFGDLVENPESGCLRTNANLLAVSGVELDYDLEEMTIDEAEDLFRARGIKAFLYTSPSHTAEKPRWRALLPFSRERAPEERDIYAVRGNGVLGGVVSDESHTRSQGYYAGRVAGVVFEYRMVNGAHIDQVDGLPEIGRSLPATAGPSGYTRETALEDIEAGHNLHGAINFLAMSGTLKADIVAALEGSTAKANDPVRWTKRMAEVDRSIRGAERRRLRTQERMLAGIPGPPRPVAQAELARPFETISAASLAGKPIPKQEWLVPDLIPAGQPSLLSGDGGLGKSLLALQLAVAVAGGGRWLGKFTAVGPALYLSAEDETEELHRRLACIAPETLPKLTSLHLAPMADLDALLAAPRNGVLGMTTLYDALAARVEEVRPALVVLDSLADVFGGNEVVRVEVRWFLGQLRKLCHRVGCSVVILAHPSLSGMATGSGLSGSTHWNNAVRSRLYLTKPKGDRVDPDERVLEVMKNNRGALGKKVAMKWQCGVFAQLDGGLAEGVTDADVDALFLELLADYRGQEIYVNNSGGSTYAPRLFAEDEKARAKRIDKRAFRDSMSRLYRAKSILVRTRRVRGHDRAYIDIA